MLSGDKDPAEIIASVKHAPYAGNCGGGQVDITRGTDGQGLRVGVGQQTLSIEGADGGRNGAGHWQPAPRCSDIRTPLSYVCGIAAGQLAALRDAMVLRRAAGDA